jgi:dCTP deaminase
VTLLTDSQISAAIKLGHIHVNPLLDGMLQPASIDIQLGNELMIYTEPRDLGCKYDPFEALDPVQPLTDEDITTVVLDKDTHYTLRPGEFLLGCTRQLVQLSASIAARVEGKSSLGRRGLMIHSTAGFIDPGFRGNITLEIANLNHRAIILRPHMWIGQLSFQRVAAAEVPYGSPGLGSHYQDATGVGVPHPLKTFQESR